MGLLRRIIRCPVRPYASRVPPSRTLFTGFRKDPYSVLGVSRNDPPDAIKAKYRKLVRENHPDRFTNEQERAAATKRVAAINAAWAQVRHSPQGGGASGGGGGGFESSFQGRRSNATEDNVQMQINAETMRLWAAAHRGTATQALVFLFQAGILVGKWAFRSASLGVVAFPFSVIMPAFAALPVLLFKFAIFLVGVLMVDLVSVLCALWIVVRMGYARMPGYYRKEAIRNVEQRIAKQAAEAAS